MSCRLELVLVVPILLAVTGCAHDTASARIPWWKGIPTQLLAPSSQEAFGWHKQRHGHTYEQQIFESGGSFAPADRSPQPTPADRETEIVPPPQPE